MTPDQLALVAESAAAATADPREFATRFYQQLFEVAPAVRPLFPSDMTEQGDKLVDELGFLIGAATDLDRFLDRARDLGRRHVDYGVVPAHYEVLKTVLIDTLAGTCADRWSDAHEEAWVRLYTLVAETMMEGAAPSLFD